ncbi:unnamed protein product [Parascedosporium putredinis]|uniref:Tr-type G domain-containing protein n=1 Tax=Parascedosporium putredinis TaxID=1442378 RepID=A0A9P1GVE1_9PEZI|nr:unnamed protein product [Parascedosporium putredinis]CAI7987770.1 unnamed protein product [Parascedosporium putredinis]
MAFSATVMRRITRRHPNVRVPARRFQPCFSCYLTLRQVHASAAQLPHGSQVKDIRNIGIIAHVDAGKTTTTERMLYCSGFSTRQGTRKGITIQSAAVTFHWPPAAKCAPGTHPKTINLIDTPGHQDFRFEVDRCLPVLDGAVCIIDGVEGVEAHTERVWGSAQEYNIPASADRQALLPEMSPDLAKELDLARENMIAVLADHDEVIMDLFLEAPDTITNEHIKSALRRTIGRGDGSVVPVFAGASLRSIGVEPLLDAIVDYLPSPDERPEVVVRSGSESMPLSRFLEKTVERGHQRLAAVASVFKVFNHPKEGLLSFVRIYAGHLPKNAAPWNTHALQVERPMGLVQIDAAKTHIVDQLGMGQIGALRGLKFARTGDTLITTVGHKPVPDAAKAVQIRPPEIPPPVAFLAIDPFGLVAANQLQTALQNTSREDPSLRWSRDEKTDQFIIQGMGKLHLDVVVHGLKKKYKIDAAFGEIEVDYKEHLSSPTSWHEAVFDRVLVNKSGTVVCSAMLEPIEKHHRDTLLESTVEKDGNIFHIQIPLPESGELPFNTEEARQQMLNGAIAALARGPGGTPSGGHFSGAARRAVQDALKEGFARGQVGVMEPIMKVIITCPESAAGVVQHDISAAAGGHVQEVKGLSGEVTVEGTVDTSKIYAPPDPYDAVTTQRKKSTTRRVQITAKVPFKEMIDYDSHLRSKTGAT